MAGREPGDWPRSDNVFAPGLAGSEKDIQVGAIGGRREVFGSNGTPGKQIVSYREGSIFKGIIRRTSCCKLSVTGGSCR